MALDMYMGGVHTVKPALTGQTSLMSQCLKSPCAVLNLHVLESVSSQITSVYIIIIGVSSWSNTHVFLVPVLS